MLDQILQIKPSKHLRVSCDAQVGTIERAGTTEACVDENEIWYTVGIGKVVYVWA